MRWRSQLVRRTVTVGLASGATLGLASATANPPPASEPGSDATVTISGHLGRTVDPGQALGGGVDGQQLGDVGRIYTPRNLSAMRSAGLGALTYRLRTELAGEAWHWNPKGRFSDAKRRDGYWVSSTGGPRFGVSYGYRLPRRGDTIDQANNDGYSRLDDGDPHSFWKSNPYLDPHFTRQSPSTHPQWILADLGHRLPVDAVSLLWGRPWARRVRVQWWDGGNAIFVTGTVRGQWRDFSHAVADGRPGRETIRVGTEPQRTRFVRILLTDSSHTAPRGSRDIRDRLGFAVRELSVGLTRPGGVRDFVHHRRSHHLQSVMWTSSTDPWHRYSDRDPNVEQPSFDRVLASGLTRGRPMLVPVPTLYGTPEDARAELRFLRRRRYPVSGVELGEEPDGQLMAPEDYGALYARFAAVVRRAAPTVLTGGPGFATSLPDWESWPDRRGVRSFVARFLGELRRHAAIGALRFFSFEWYPFDDVCAPTSPQLESAPGLLASILARQRAAGLPVALPKLITEYGYSAYAGRPEVDRAGAVFDADTVGSFLTLGGRAAFLYGYEPAPLAQEVPSCRTWGNLALLLSDTTQQVRARLASFYAVRMLTRDWAAPARPAPRLLSTQVTDTRPATRVGAYALLRADGSTALLLTNRESTRTLRVELRYATPGANAPLQLTQLSAADYVWHPRGPSGFARPDAPPLTSRLAAGLRVVSLPPLSVTVVRSGAPG